MPLCRAPAPAAAAESVTQLLSQYGQVQLVRICARGNTSKLPGWLGKAVEAANLNVGHGEYALVEFGSEDECVACVTKTRNPDNWCAALGTRHACFLTLLMLLSGAGRCCGGHRRGGCAVGRSMRSLTCAVRCWPACPHRLRCCCCCAAAACCAVQPSAAARAWPPPQLALARRINHAASLGRRSGSLAQQAGREAR